MVGTIRTGNTITKEIHMLQAITISGIFVLDQDEALDFYVGKLGLEVSNDIDMGFMRWLTVRVPGETNRDILLETPGPPAMDQSTAEQARDLLTKGATGFAVGFSTDDCRKTYEMLRAKGVEFTQEPTEHFYGIDCALRDPFGNQIRIAQLTPAPAQVAEAASHA
jgi:catechol 2,3-dioxygenase-like lactoylglutathione lyase family enzyme